MGVKYEDVFPTTLAEIGTLAVSKVSKFNPYHDSGTGRFTSGPGGGGANEKAIWHDPKRPTREQAKPDGKPFWSSEPEQVDASKLRWGDVLIHGGKTMMVRRVDEKRDGTVQIEGYPEVRHQQKRYEAGGKFEGQTPPSGTRVSERESVVVDAGTKVDALRISHKKKKKVSKFNPYHDQIGRFTTAGSNTTGAPGGYPGGRPVKGGKPAAGGKPIKTGDVKEALRLLAEGKHVELESVEQVSTMVNQLNKIVQDAVKKGNKAPSYDLCRVSVANTNIFCAEHKDIPRIKMPQLKGEPVKGSKAAGMKKNQWGEVDVAEQFIQKMKDEGVAVKRETVKSNTLKASQSELVGRKVAEMVSDARAGNFDPEAGTIYVSKDGYIIDGHHRWAATIALDAGEGGRLGDRTINVVRIEKPILQVLDEANEFTLGIGIKPRVGKSTQPS